MAGGRNLVVLADGTGNSAAKAFKTNVWRLYEALDLNGADQIAVFSDGVGTSTFKPFQIIGLALGFGVKRRVLALYKFLCLNYKEKDDNYPGDKIYAFGFSRGAFTIRALVGLIHREGLVNFNSREELDRNALAAYRAYRREAFKPRKPWTIWVPALRNLRDCCIYLWNKSTSSRQYGEVKPTAGGRAAKNVKIRFLGVWDTVAAYGLPIDELTRAVDKWIWPMSFGDTKLLDSVECARQAFSIDDERRTFFPIPWDEKSKPELLRSENGKPPRLRQVWFAGVHANVGGGYPDDRLAHIPLCWMIGEAKESGLCFDDEIVADYWNNASESGRRYDSRSGLGVFYRYHPRSAKELMDGQPLVDSSVIIRMAKGSDRYGPIALPDNVDVLTPYDECVSLAQLGGGSMPAPSPPPPDKLPLPVGRSRNLPAMQQELYKCAEQIVVAKGPNRSKFVELMHDSVWWGRVIYYVTLAFFVIAGLYPLLAGYVTSEHVDDADSRLEGLIHPVAGLLKGFLPGLAAPWLQAITDNPAGAIVLAVAIGICLWIGGFARTRIQDRARAVWNIDRKEDEADDPAARRAEQRRFFSISFLILIITALFALIMSDPPSEFAIGAASILGLGAAICAWKVIRMMGRNAGNPGGQSSTALRLARAVRTNRSATSLYCALKETWLPATFIVLTSFLIFCVANKVSFDFANSVGWICEAPPEEAGTPDPGKKSDGAKKPVMTSRFATGALCADTGLDLDQGVTYYVQIKIDQSWNDGDTSRADVLGVRETKETGGLEWIVRRTGTLLKRWWGESYYQTIARIGPTGNDEYALKSITPLVGEEIVVENGEKIKKPVWHDAMTAQIIPRKSGRLYLYANDATFGLPWIYGLFYRCNKGEAGITIWEPGPRHPQPPAADAQASAGS